jgi:uncharacterized membrane protein YfcA
MSFDLTFFIVAVPAVLIAGISKGGFGSGASFVAAPILALIVDPILALGVMLPLLMLIDVASLKAYWGKWSAKDSRLLVLGSLPGIAAGAVLARAADPDIFRLLIGGICFAFFGWQVFQSVGGLKNEGRDYPRPVALLAGAFAGFTSFVSHAGGPVVAVYLLSKGLGKTSYQATSVIVFWAMNILKFIPYAALGFFTSETILANLLLAPAALIGTWLGVRAHAVVPERVFFAITYILLIGTGSKLIWDALT